MDINFISMSFWMLFVVVAYFIENVATFAIEHSLMKHQRRLCRVIVILKEEEEECCCESF